MTEQNPRPLEYATPVSRPRGTQPTAVAVVTIISGTVLLLAPWICMGLGNASVTSLTRGLNDWHFFWLTEVLGFTMILVAYFRAAGRGDAGQ